MSDYEVMEQAQMSVATIFDYGMHNGASKDELTERFYMLDMPIENKFDGAIEWMQNLEMQAEHLQKLIDGLKMKQMAIVNDIDEGKKVLQDIMQDNDIDTIKGDLHKVHLRPSERIVCENEDMFCEWAMASGKNNLVTTKVETKPNKAEIKKALKNGEELLMVAVEQRKNLQVD